MKRLDSQRRKSGSTKRHVVGRSVSAVEVTGASPQLPITEARVFSAAGMTAHQVRIDSKTGLDFRWEGQSHYLALHDMQNLDSETFLDSQPADRRRDLRGRLTFVAAGCRVWGWGIPDVSPQSFTALYLDPAQMEVEVARKLKNLPEKSELYFKNSALQTTLEKLQQALMSETRADSMYLESVCLTAMLELCSYRQEAGVEATRTRQPPRTKSGKAVIRVCGIASRSRDRPRRSCSAGRFESLSFPACLQAHDRPDPLSIPTGAQGSPRRRNC